MNRVSRQAPRLVMLVLALAALLLAGAPGATAAPAAGEYDAAVQKAATWIVGQQQADGSFPGFGVGSTADAIYALAAAGRDVRAVAKNGVTPIGFLTTKAKDYAKTPGAAAKLLLALATARDSTDPHNFGGVDLLQVIDNGYDAASGHYGKDVTGQALVLLAGKALNQPVPPAAVDWLVKAQAVDGGWAFDGSTDAGKADTNTTGLVLQALAAAHAGNATVVQKALAYLHAQQEADGGFAYQKGPGNASDTNSTALVAMGLQAAGESPDGAAWKQGGASPLDFLVKYQNPSGAFRYQATPPDDNAGATYQVLPALAGVVLPVPPAPQLPAPAGNPPGMPTTGQGPTPDLPLAALLALLLVLGGRRLTTRPARD